MKENNNPEPSILTLVEFIVNALESSQLSPDAINSVSEELITLSQRVGVTPKQAIWLALIINMADDSRIAIRDFARLLGCKSVTIQKEWEEIEALEEKRYIYINKHENGRTFITMPHEVMNAFRNNDVYQRPSYENMSEDAYYEVVDLLFSAREMDELPYKIMIEDIERMHQNNPTLPFVHFAQEHTLKNENLIIVLLTAFKYVMQNDECIQPSDLINLLPKRVSTRQHFRLLTKGAHPLMSNDILELNNEDGQVMGNSWHLTDKSKLTLFKDIESCVNEVTNRDLILHDELKLKKLFFESKTNNSIEQLTRILMPERFQLVQERLEQKGMRKGFACLLHGAPGTGKTESVYQIAKKTGRNIMMVDIPSIRSKWVGDTEKNVKGIFRQYSALVKKNKIAPILLINEADAVLCKRNSNASSGVDKMENAMQNIFLQELENLDGILIATTNLATSMDKAFERRFLYKIEYANPTPNESRHIWQSMIPELSDEDAYNLASRYSFSGGQIENIARKQIINSILLGDGNVSIDDVRDACSVELLHSKTLGKPVGFH